MPYSSIAELPAHVKKLSPNKKKRWMNIFNSVFNRTKSEERAFRAANAIINESAIEGNIDIDGFIDLNEIWETKEEWTEIRFRVQRPELFVGNTIKRKNIAPGVSLVIGKKKTGGSMETQAIRFDKKRFTLAQAKKWVSDHGGRAQFVKEDSGMRKNGIRSFEHIMDLSEALGPSFLSKEKGVIENVVILTGEKVSRNKTFYTQKALSEAVKRYEGAKMFIDHPEKGKEGARSVRDLGGTYRNVRIEENKFLKADLHLLPNDNVRNLVFPLAEAKLPGVGLSIRDRGRGREEDGIFLVEGFSKTNGYSIDLVTEASVNENLFESDEGGDDMKLSEATLEDLQAENAALVEKIRGDERQAVLKELEEKIKGGEDATKILSQGKKLILLAEAGLPGDIVDKVKKIIEPESVSLEVAESIITQQKEIVESLKASTKPNDPKVKGHGDSKDKDTQEGDVPNAEELAESLMNL